MPESQDPTVVLVSSTESVQSQHRDIEIYLQPIRPLVEICTNKEDEEELITQWARLYRYNTVDHEWKERGAGPIKLLRNKVNNKVRVVMRRDNTFKVCANHFITPDTQLHVHRGSDRAFMWSAADFADEVLKPELLAIKFRSAQSAAIWKQTFDEALRIVRTKCIEYARNNSFDDLSSWSDFDFTDSSDDY